MLPSMSAPASPPARPWVVDDLETMPDDGYRREIIGGVLIVSPSPALQHQVCSGGLYRALYQARSPEFVVVYAPYDWRPPSGENFVPDLMVLNRSDCNPAGPLRATPALAIEILSPSNADLDRGLKRMAYARLGVPAYWIVDPSGPGVLALRLNEKGRYVEVARASGKRRFKVDFPYPVELIPADLVEL